MPRRTFRLRQPSLMHTAPCEFPVLSEHRAARCTAIGMGSHHGCDQTVTIFYESTSCILPEESRGLLEFDSHDVHEQELRLAQAIRERNLIGS